MKKILVLIRHHGGKAIVLFILVSLLPNRIVHAQTWQPLGNGAYREPGNGTVAAIYCDSISHVEYVGGGFDTAGLLYSPNFANWKDSEWIAGNCPFLGTNQIVSAITKYHGDLYIATANEIGNTSYVLKYDGSSWSYVGTFNNWVVCLLVYHDVLIAGGIFTQQGGDDLWHIAQWNDSTWQPLGGGLIGSVYALAEYSNTLYAGGAFHFEVGYDSVLLHIVGKWNGTHWQPLKGGVDQAPWGDGIVNALEAYNGELYVTGSISHADTVECDHMAKWNGSDWSVVAQNQYAFGFAFKVYNGKLYVVGGFSDSGNWFNVAALNIDTWEDLGFGDEGSVVALDIIHDTLYVGGQFFSADSTAARNIAMIDLTSVPTSVVSSGLSSLQIHPNPTTTYTNIVYNIEHPASLTLTNTYGSVVKQLTLYPYFKNRIVYVDDLAEGIYLVTMKEGSGIDSKKVVVEK